MQNVGVDWMDGWIPLRLLRLLEHLQCYKSIRCLLIACSFLKLQNNQDVNGEVLDQKKIDRVEFKNLIIENIVIISRQEILLI